MIDLYYWPTPNGWKISIMLEECGLPYTLKPVHIGRGEQFTPEFLRISPNNRIPAIVDHEAPGGPTAVFESGAILAYLAEKASLFLPTTPIQRHEVIQWVFWQVSNLGPMAGQLSHFVNYAPGPNEYSRQRYRNETDRLFGVMDHRLADRAYLAGEYSIADIASWPWVRPWRNLGLDLDAFAHLRSWYDRIKARPAVQRGIDVGKDLSDPGAADEEARRVLFGQTARSVAAATGRAST